MTGRSAAVRIAAAWLFGFALAGVYAAGRFVPPAGWTTNDVTTGASPGYPDLAPRQYDSSPDNTTVVAAAVADRVLNWTLSATDLAAHTVRCEVRGPLGLSADDVTVRVEAVGPCGSASRVVIRSRSRGGFGGDLGANARNVRALQAAMDEKLPPLTP